MYSTHHQGLVCGCIGQFLSFEGWHSSSPFKPNPVIVLLISFALLLSQPIGLLRDTVTEGAPGEVVTSHGSLSFSCLPLSTTRVKPDLWGLLTHPFQELTEYARSSARQRHSGASWAAEISHVLALTYSQPLYKNSERNGFYFFNHWTCPLKEKQKCATLSCRSQILTFTTDMFFLDYG